MEQELDCDYMYRKRMEREEMENQKEQIHLNIYSSFEQNQLDLTKLKENNFKWDIDSFTPGYVNEDGLSYIPKMNLEVLIQNFLIDNYKNIFLAKDLYCRPFNPKKISGIINCWLQDIKVPPPVIYKGFKSDKLYCIDDGLHRIKVSYYLGVKEIPIFIGS